MSQALPTGGFQWVNDIESEGVEELKNEHSTQAGGGEAFSQLKILEEKIKKVKKDSSVGYILEVDLLYPEELHDLHDTFPCAPEHVNIEPHLLSSQQKKLAEKLNIKPGGRKLCLTLQSKTSYILHIRNLQQYLELGLKLTAVHRILKFEQSPWLKKYIEKNTELRKSAESKFEQGFAKVRIFFFLHFLANV